MVFSSQTNLKGFVSLRSQISDSEEYDNLLCTPNDNYTSYISDTQTKVAGAISAFDLPSETPGIVHESPKSHTHPKVLQDISMSSQPFQFPGLSWEADMSETQPKVLEQISISDEPSQFPGLKCDLNTSDTQLKVLKDVSISNHQSQFPGLAYELNMSETQREAYPVVTSHQQPGTIVNDDNTQAGCPQSRENSSTPSQSSQVNVVNSEATQIGANSQMYNIQNIHYYKINHPIHQEDNPVTQQTRPVTQEDHPVTQRVATNTKEVHFSAGMNQPKLTDLAELESYYSNLDLSDLGEATVDSELPDITEIIERTCHSNFTCSPGKEKSTGLRKIVEHSHRLKEPASEAGQSSNNTINDRKGRKEVSVDMTSVGAGGALGRIMIAVMSSVLLIVGSYLIHTSLYDNVVRVVDNPSTNLSDRYFDGMNSSIVDSEGQKVYPGDILEIRHGPQIYAIYAGKWTIIRCRKSSRMVVKEDLNLMFPFVKCTFAIRGTHAQYSRRERVSRALSLVDKVFTQGEKVSDFPPWVYAGVGARQVRFISKDQYSLDNMEHVLNDASSRPVSTGTTYRSDEILDSRDQKLEPGDIVEVVSPIWTFAIYVGGGEILRCDTWRQVAVQEDLDFLKWIGKCNVTSVGTCREYSPTERVTRARSRIGQRVCEGRTVANGADLTAWTYTGLGMKQAYGKGFRVTC